MTVQFLIRVFGIPLGLLFLGCVPVISWFLYSGHGGLAWLVLPLCFPYIVLRLTIGIWKLPQAVRLASAKTALTALCGYMLIAYPVTRWTEHYLASSIGLSMPTGTLFKLAIFPIGYASSLFAAKG